MKCSNCQGNHSTVDQARECWSVKREESDREMVARVQKRNFKPASEKQVNYIKTLVAERGVPAEGSADFHILKRFNETGEISKESASDLITTLKGMTRTVEVRQVSQNLFDLEGVHMLDGQYVKVQIAIHGSGKPYAKKFYAETQTWEYAGREPLARLSKETRLDAEQAAEFGHLYGQCVFCARGLTDERSISVGYGATCADNHGLPWGG